MKTLKQIKEEYDNKYLTQDLPDELMLEGREGVSKIAPRTVPSPSDMPNMLLFRRVAYRLYPNKQVVALYYSKTVDKYLSVPFGPDGNLNLSESEIHEGKLKTAAKTIGGGLLGATHGAIRGAMKGSVIGADPGFAIGGAIGAVKGAYKGAKKAYDKVKEQEKDMNEDWSDVKHQNPSGGLKKSGVMAYRRENPGSKLQTAVTTKPSKLKPGSKAANRRKSFCARMGGMKKRLTSAKTARDPDSRINKALRKWNCEESFKLKLQEKRQERLDENPLLKMLGTAIADKALSYFTGSGKDDKKESGNKSAETNPAITSRRGELLRGKPGARTKSSWERAGTTDATFQARQKAAISKELKSPQKVQENKISDIRKMINENADSMDLFINGKTISLNNSMAKKIIKVYESVNTKNKKIVEGMLNEDFDSFKKLLNFSIKA